MNKIERALAKLQRDRDGEAPVPSLGRLVEIEPAEVAVAVAERNAPRAAASGAGVHTSYRQGRQVQVDRMALRRAGLLAPETQERKLSDEYRQIKRPLLANASGRGAVPIHRANLLMVGSAVPGEGKTFTCINLCLSLALEKDWSVVLVDGDVAKPHLTMLFGLQDEPGLMDLLRAEDDAFEDYVLRTDMPGLSIMPAGRSEEHAAELLSSARMDEIAQHLADSDPRRMIVFDSPPLLATSESPALAAHMGQVVLVVAAGETPQQRVQLAIGKLDHSKAVNLILNKAELSGDAMAYGGGQYGYGYGYRGGAGSHDVP